MENKLDLVVSWCILVSTTTLGTSSTCLLSNKWGCVSQLELVLTFPGPRKPERGSELEGREPSVSAVAAVDTYQGIGCVRFKRRSRLGITSREFFPRKIAGRVDTPAPLPTRNLGSSDLLLCTWCT